jgi:hypothetical protein
MAEVGAVGKNGKNMQQKYKYRSIDDMYNALQPALSKHRVFITPEILERDEQKLEKGYKVRLTVKYKVYAEDGSFIECITQGECIDYSDKATNKALTAAFKYMCIQLFCIAVEGDEDADSQSPSITEVKEKPQRKNHAPKTKDSYIVEGGRFEGQDINDIDKEELVSFIKKTNEYAENNNLDAPIWFKNLEKEAMKRGL